MKKIYFIATVAFFFLVLWKYSSCRSHQLFGSLINRVKTKQRVVALTLDDGPSSAYTKKILALLNMRKVKATFFINGGPSKKNVSLAQKIVQGGHDLGNHSKTHTRMIFKSVGFVRDEIQQTSQLIRKAGFKKEIVFRPPYGKKLFSLPYYLSKVGMKTIMWDIEPESYPSIASSPEKMASHVIKRIRPGSIILLHVMFSSRKVSRRALPLIIEGVRKKGYRFVTISKLLSLQRKE